METVTCWFFNSGKQTEYLQYERAVRRFSHHSRVNAYLELRAERVAARLAEGPPTIDGAPHVSHVMSWLDNLTNVCTKVVRV